MFFVGLYGLCWSGTVLKLGFEFRRFFLCIYFKIYGFWILKGTGFSRMLWWYCFKFAKQNNFNMYLLMENSQGSKIVTDSLCYYTTSTYPSPPYTCSCRSFSSLDPTFIPIVESVRHSSSNGYFSFFITVIFWLFLTSDSSADQEHSGTISLHSIVSWPPSQNPSVISLYLLIRLYLLVCLFIGFFTQMDWHIYSLCFIGCSLSFGST